MPGFQQPPQAPSNAGTGDNGQTWDPSGGPDGKGAWIPRPASGNMPTDERGDPAYSSAETGQGGQLQQYGEMTPGRVREGNAAQGTATGGAWGGYSGTVVIGPDGQPRYDGNLSGRQADVDRLRALGDKAAGQETYQLNYGNANADAGMGLEDRARQDKAIALARNAALGKDSVAQALGQRTLAQGAQMQQAGAMSTRGGPLAAVGAMKTQQNNEAAYTQRGNTALRANLADEMAAGRSQLAGMADTQRAGDVAAQSQNQKQTINQASIEQGQRDLNQAGKMGYEGMAGGVNEAAQRGALANLEESQGVDAAASARATRNSDAQTGAALGMVNTARDAYGSYQKGENDDAKRPPTSDRRAKSMASLFGKRG